MSVFHLWSDMKYLGKTGHRVRTFFLGWGKRQKTAPLRISTSPFKFTPSVPVVDL